MTMATAGALLSANAFSNSDATPPIDKVGRNCPLEAMIAPCSRTTGMVMTFDLNLAGNRRSKYRFK